MIRGLALAALLALGQPALAQDRAQTLADVRQELQILFADIQRLRRELSTTGPATGVQGGGDMIGRIDAIEAELRRLVGVTEALELRVGRVASDGAARIADLEFRLCELEPDCDTSTLEPGDTLGGVAVDTTAPAVAAPATPTTPPAPSMAVGERGDYDRARAAFEAGDYAAAAQRLEAFAQAYPVSPLRTEALYLLGEAQAAQGAWRPAARAYLDAFSGDPAGTRAGDSLLNVGVALGQLDQTTEACLTLAEVIARFPGSPAAAEALTTQTAYACP